ncbi:hypothetical protein [uncultured Xylophilus sp.]|uniref:hypothetical protein n=1 Tax=uncultured Xylophilus sp. TaxID=296832 RepID=UPI0025F46253|nr:hypothetical protein [uncultured Xylophilus sp.]
MHQDEENGQSQRRTITTRSGLWLNRMGRAFMTAPPAAWLMQLIVILIHWIVNPDLVGMAPTDYRV